MKVRQCKNCEFLFGSKDRPLCDMYADAIDRVPKCHIYKQRVTERRKNVQSSDSR